MALTVQLLEQFSGHILAWLMLLKFFKLISFAVGEEEQQPISSSSSLLHLQSKRADPISAGKNLKVGTHFSVN